MTGEIGLVNHQEIKVVILVMKMIGTFTNCLESFTQRLEMSPFKKAAVKGGSSKGKELVIDVDDHSPQTKRT